MNENKYKDEKYYMLKKLIEHYIEIEEYKEDLNKRQKTIDDIVNKTLKERQINQLEGDYCFVRLEIEENKKINYIKDIDILIKNGHKDVLELIEGKRLLEYMIKNNRAMDYYKTYIKNKDKENKIKLIDELIAKDRLDLLKFDLDIIKNIYADKNSNKEKKYLENIIKKNQNEILIYDYIK